MERTVSPGDTLLGKYVVERVLGRGGMGVVLAARHLELGQMFAVKLLLPRALDSEHGVQRFLREARAAARLRSEHVARVVDVGHLDDGAPYMVMEYLEGCDLAALLRARGPLPPEEAIDYVLQACEAIAEAHAAGIVHRDLKPANLFLTRRPGGAPWVKVLDFGISKHADAGGIELTQTGAVLGSPQYMAPEQVRSTRAADPRSDIWSMGVVLYKLVTGVLPFQGEAAPEVIAAVLQDDAAPPSAVRPGLPMELDGVLLRALQKKPDQRFQRIEDLAAALRAVAGISSTTVRIPPAARTSAVPAAEPTGPTLGGASYDAAMTLRRRNHRVALAFATAGIAAALMLVAGFLLGSRWGGRAAEGASAEAPAEGSAAPGAAGQGAVYNAPSVRPAAGGSLPSGGVAAEPPGAAASVEPAPAAAGEIGSGAGAGGEAGGATGAAAAAGTAAGASPGAAATPGPGHAAAAPGKSVKRVVHGATGGTAAATAAPPPTAKPRTIF